MIKRPLKAHTLKNNDLKKLSFPLILTPKIDGIRCLKTNGTALSKSFNPIPNRYIRSEIERIAPDGFDGEIIIKGVTDFNKIQSAVMSFDGEPDFEYLVFDYIRYVDRPYILRLEDLETTIKSLDGRLKTVEYHTVNNLDELLHHEEIYFKAGYEGIMLRTPNSPHKNGQSTFNESFLLKYKRFFDQEGTVVGFLEQMRNENKAEKDEFGLTKRSSKKDGYVPDNTLGKFLVNTKNPNTGEDVVVEIGTGTGLTKTLRKTIWDNKDLYVNKIITFEYQEWKGDKPRFPTYKGFRDPIDMD